VRYLRQVWESCSLIPACLLETPAQESRREKAPMHLATSTLTQQKVRNTDSTMRVTAPPRTVMVVLLTCLPPATLGWLPACCWQPPRHAGLPAARRNELPRWPTQFDLCFLLVRSPHVFCPAVVLVANVLCALFHWWPSRELHQARLRHCCRKKSA